MNAELQFGFKKASISSIQIFNSAVVLCGAYVHPINLCPWLGFLHKPVKFVSLLIKIPLTTMKDMSKKSKGSKKRWKKPEGILQCSFKFNILVL